MSGLEFLFFSPIATYTVGLRLLLLIFLKGFNRGGERSGGLGESKKKNRRRAQSLDRK